MNQSYKRLPIEEFSEYLFRTEDLDPIYTILHKARIQGVMAQPDLVRWCVAYWLDYHSGTCSWVTDRPSPFWESMYLVAENKPIMDGAGWGEPKIQIARFPRGVERRHFRGEQALQMVRRLSAAYTAPAEFVDYLVQNDNPLTFSTVANRVKEHYGFGNWVAFKVADMLERVLGYPVDFSDCHLGFYESPLKGGHEVCQVWYEPTYQLNGALPPKEPVPAGLDLTDKQACLKHATSRLQDHFKETLAPPDFKRKVGLQEIETCLCKWHSSLSGHYPLGKDTHEIREGLHGWGPLADKLRTFLPGD